MNLRKDHKTLAAFAACLLSFLPACERVLDVVEQIEPPSSGSSGGSAGTGGAPATPPTPCECASSPGLQALSCGYAPVALVDNDVVQTTFDGSIVAFNVCGEALFDCRVAYWDGDVTNLISSGLMLGLSASGQRVLSTGDGFPAGLELIDLSGTAVNIELDMLSGRGPLSAAGDTVFGAQWIEDRSYLARADADSQEIELLGELDGPPTRTYITPDAAHIVGWLFTDLEDSTASTVFRWDEQAGLTFGLPGLAADLQVWPEAISADGRVIAGRVFPNTAHFRYTEADGLTELTTTSGRSETFISRDGNVVVGSHDPLNDGLSSSTFRWTAQSGAVDLTPGVESLAVDASDDGGVVVASSWEEDQIEGAEPDQTFVWDGEHGTRSLGQVLQDRGIDAAGWEFGHARAISGDGKVLLGRARCGGAPTLYRVVLAD